MDRRVKIKNKKSVFILLSFILFNFMIFIIIYNINNPFKSKEGKRIGKLYHAAEKGINIFRMPSYDIYEGDLYFYIKRSKRHCENFTEEEFKCINKMMEQLVNYLNNKDDFSDLFSKVVFEFYMSNDYVKISCHAEKRNGIYKFVYVETE